MNRALYSSPINDSLMAQIYLSKIDWDEGKMIKAKNKALKIFDHAACAENLHIQELVLESLAKMSLYAGNYRDAFKFQSMQLDVDSALQANRDINELLHRKYNFEYSQKVLRDSINYLRASNQLQMDIQNNEAALVREKEKRNFYLISFIMTLLGLAAIALLYFQVRKAKNTSDNLLLNILPEETANELKQKGYTDAKEFEQATILFADFKGFTSMSEQMSASELVDELNVCFKAFDHIMEKHKLEKIKTIGDAYMAAGGLPVPDSASPADVVRAGLEMQEFIASRKTKHDELGLPSFQMRVGIHTGPVIAGVVGVKKFQYDIWGDTVNTASRMESSGTVGKVNISNDTYLQVKGSANFTFESRGKIQAKGKGELKMWYVSSK